MVPVCAGTCEYDHVTVSRRVDTDCVLQGGTYPGWPCALGNASRRISYTHGELEKFSLLPTPAALLRASPGVLAYIPITLNS